MQAGPFPPTLAVHAGIFFKILILTKGLSEIFLHFVLNSLKPKKKKNLKKSMVNILDFFYKNLSSLCLGVARLYYPKFLLLGKDVFIKLEKLHLNEI